MTTEAERTESQSGVRRYEIRYPVSAYTFPGEALIHLVRFVASYIHVELMDGRILSVPLQWIPTLCNASPDEREKYEIDRSRTVVVWDPDKCAINDELRIADYLAPAGRSLEADT